MYTEILNTTGLSQRSMELFVLLGICISVVGFLIVTYWRYILFGAFSLFCVVVLAHQKVDTPNAEIAKSQQVQKEPQLDEEGQRFLEDCQAYTDYSKERCTELWNNRESVKGKEQRARILNAKYKVL